MSTNTINDIRPASKDASPEKKLKSKFHTMYKMQPTAIDKQEERRESILKVMKQKRESLLNEKRGIHDVFNDMEMEFEEKNTDINDAIDASGGSMQVDDKKITKRNKDRRKHHPYRNRLMYSEWLASIPTEFEMNWYFKICPKGKRCLLVAHNSVTIAYDKVGKIISKFQSDIPGGGTNNGQYPQHKFTILDCIYNFNLRTYFILDIIAWNSYSFSNFTAECRFFFLKSKLEELPLNENKTNGNLSKFIEVPSFRCEYPTLSHNLNETPTDIKTDGILFYHKDGLYTTGITPLVLWLKPYMIPEILHMQVHVEYMKQTPTDYVDHKTRITAKPRRKSTEMATSVEIEMKFEDHMEDADVDRLTEEDG